MTEPLLVVENLDVRYGTSQALFDVSLGRGGRFGHRGARCQRSGEEHAWRAPSQDSCPRPPVA